MSTTIIAAGQLHRSMSHLIAQLTHDLELPRYAQHALWAVIPVVHVLVGAISLLFAVIYLTLLVKSAWAKDILPFVGLQFSVSVTFAAAVLASVCSAAHLVQAARAIGANCSAMRQRVRPIQPAPAVQHRGRCYKLPSVIMRTIALVSIRGQHFDTFFLAREVITVVLQTYLCHRLATSIVNEATHNASMVLLAFNSVSTPMVHVVGRRWDVLTRRLVCLVVDAVIDLTSSLIMPIAICLPYFRVFVQISPSAQASKGHDPIFVCMARDELGIAIATSAITCAVVYIPALTLLIGLSDIKALLMSVHSRPKQKKRDLVQRRRPAQRSAIAHRVPHIAMMLYGVVIAIVIAAARSPHQREAMSVCQARLHPWSPQRVACGVVLIDCIRESINGTSDEIRQRLEDYDLATIEVVTIAHCSRLEMPSTLQQLRSLFFLEIYNSTLAAWGHDAELAATFHPQLMTVLIIDVDLALLGSTLPVGLLGDNIPDTILNFVVANTYLREVPVDFHLKWKHRILSLQFNNCGLRSLPDGFGQLRGGLRMSVSRNHLTSMPHNFSSLKTSKIFNINGNPIKLPRSGNVSGLSLLVAQDTRIDAIPTWLLDASPALIVGAHSPFCNDQPDWKVLDKTNVTCKEMDATQYEFGVADWIHCRGLS